MNDEQATSIQEVLTGFPKYVYGYLSGFVYGALCDMTLTSLTLGSIALGWATQWQLGVAAFFFGHFSIRATNARSASTMHSGRAIAGGLHRLASLFPQPSAPSEDETPAT